MKETVTEPVPDPKNPWQTPEKAPADARSSPDRSVPALVLLLLGCVFERMSYFAVRSFLILFLRKSGLDEDAAMGALGQYSNAILFLPLVVGGIAWFVSARKLSVASALVCVVGMVVLSTEAITPGLAIMALGQAGVKVGLFVWVAQWVWPLPFSKQVGTFLLVSAAINVGGFMGPMTTGLLRGLSSMNQMVIGAAVIAFLAALSLGAAFALDRTVPFAGRPKGRPGLGVGLIFALSVPGFVLMAWMGAQNFGAPSGADDVGRLLGISFISGFVGLVAIFVCLLISPKRRSRWIVGSLAIVLAGPLVAFILGILTHETPFVGASLLILNVSGFWGPAVTSTLIAHVRPRAAGLVWAGFIWLQEMIEWIGGALTHEWSLAMTSGLAVFVALTVVAVGLLQRPLTQQFFLPIETKSGSPA